MGTTGIDAELVTSLHPKWMLRGGVSALAVDFTAKMNLYDHGKEYANRTDINGEVRMVNIARFLSDPFGIFRIGRFLSWKQGDC